MTATVPQQAASRPAPFEASYHDPARVCPMPAGASLLEGSRWTVRLAQGDATIEAPAALLHRVANACDGTRPLADIVDHTRPASLKPKVAGLVQDLLQSGVLVDAALYPVAAQRFAWAPSPFGNPAPRSAWEQVPRRFAPCADTGPADAPPARTALDDLLATRHSVHTFGDGPVDEAALRSYLWVLAGVVAPRHEHKGGSVARRTIPSGGAVHALRPVLVLRQAVGRWAPGVYAVHYPAARQVHLQPLHAEVAWLPRAVLHPWYLGFATGMVFLVADPRLGAIKYLGRALQYLFIEAGAALQNAALAAPPLGLAMTAYGGYIESELAPRLGLQEPELVLAAAVFGAAPSAEHLRLERAAPRLQFGWADAASPLYAMPYFVGRCQVREPAADAPPVSESWGRDADPWLAYVKAAVEAIERQGFRSPRGVQPGRLADWDAALDPRSVLRYTGQQYREPGFGLQPFDDTKACGWVAGRSLRSGQAIHVLAEQVYAHKPLRETLPQWLAGYCEANSSGCAAHTQPQQALEFAVLELVERDAYMRAWLAQHPGVQISARSLPTGLQRRARALQALGCHVSVQKLPSPWAQVAVAYARHEGLHFTVVGAGARATLQAAAEAAMDELETLAYARLHEPDLGTMQPRQVRLPREHSQLYASQRYFRHADALIDTPAQAGFAKLAGTAAEHGTAVERLLAAGHDVVAVDITVPGSAIDQGRTPVTVVRALVPGLVPISFGYHREPLGCVDRVHPRGRFPHPFP